MSAYQMDRGIVCRSDLDRVIRAGECALEIAFAKQGLRHLEVRLPRIRYQRDAAVERASGLIITLQGVVDRAQYDVSHSVTVIRLDGLFSLASGIFEFIVRKIQQRVQGKSP